MAGAELSEDELEILQDSVRIGSINDDTFEDEDDIEYVQLKFYTTQKEDYKEKYAFFVRVTMEMTDKKTSTICYSKFGREQGEVDIEYTGEDTWKFIVAQGDMKRPKVTAYVVQYGVIVDKKFVVLAEETDDVDTIIELTERTPTLVEQKPHIIHEYSFRDSEGEVQQSGPE